jgi:molecular chaperone Hsp33
MLQSLGEEEALAAAAGGMAEIRCEFCGQQYRFDPAEIGALFRPHGVPVEPPARLQ